MRIIEGHILRRRLAIFALNADVVRQIVANTKHMSRLIEDITGLVESFTPAVMNSGTKFKRRTSVGCRSKVEVACAIFHRLLPRPPMTFTTAQTAEVDHDRNDQNYQVNAR
jgi:hypothetical protein